MTQADHNNVASQGAPYEIATLTAQGARENNEDAFRVVETADACMLLVADGLGGYEGGEKASAVVADVCASCFHAFPKATEENILSIFAAAQDAVKTLQKETGGRMKTTLGMYMRSPEGAVIAHTGDTRVYLIADGKIRYQTFDHSVAGQSVRMKELKEKKIRSSPDRHKLLRTIGGDNPKPTLYRVPDPLCHGIDGKVHLIQVR